MNPKTIQLIFNISIVAAAFCNSVWLYNSFGPNLPKVDHTCIVIEGILSIIIIVIVLTKKKWNKQESAKSES
jgi:hypothetical protein